MTHSQFDESSEKLKQKRVHTLRTMPLEVKRVITDVRFIISFGVFIVFWIAISSYAFCIGESKYLTHPNYWILMEIYSTMQEFYKYIGQAKYLLLGSLAWSLLLICIFATLLRWTTKAFLIITIVLVSFGVVMLYGLLIYATYSGFLNLYLCICIAVITALYVLIIYAFIKARINIVYKVIKESCKAIFFFPSILIFAIIQMSLQLLVLSFTFCIFMYLLSIRAPVDIVANTNTTTLENENEKSVTLEMHKTHDNPWHYYENTIIPFPIYLFHAVNFFGFLWTTWFIMGLGRMVLTAVFATWYQTKDKNTISKMIIPKCFLMIVRYHSGTLAYASSPLSIISIVYITYKYELDRLKKMHKRPMLLFTWLTIFLKFSFDAMTMCAIHGNPFYKSAKESYFLIMRNSVSYLKMIIVSEYLIVLGMLQLLALSFVSIYAYCYFLQPNISIYAQDTAVLIVPMTCLLMALTLSMVFRSASSTISYYYFEDSKFNNEAEMKLDEIQVGVSLIHDTNEDP